MVMTNEAAEVENYETIDVDMETGGGGYVDDDIDLDDDDDDDDEPLIPTSGPRVPTAPLKPLGNARPATNLSPLTSLKKRTRPPPAAPLRKGPPAVVDDILPTDYKLRAAGVKNVREFVVAKFREGIPDWNASTDEQNHMRLYREGEGTLDQRKEGLAADEKEKKYMDSYRGQRRTARREKQGHSTIRGRLLRDWKLEVAPESVSKRLVTERQNRIEKRLKRGEEGLNEAEKEESGEESESEDASLSEIKSLVTSYTGQFEGRTIESNYVVMVVDESTRMIDVVPVGDCSMFMFRADQKASAKSAEEVESIAKRMRLKREKDPRLNHFATSVMGKQVERELMMGDRSVLAAMPDVYQAGIQRGSVPAKFEEELGAEDFDFEQEFDNDDLLQVDKEEAKKPIKEVLVDEEKRIKDFQKMIKDEPEMSKENSEGDSGEGEEDAEGGDEGEEDGKTKVEPTTVGQDVQKADKKPASSMKLAPTSKPASRDASPNITSSVRLTPSMATASVGTRRSAGASPSSAATRRGGTPQLLDLSHLLPKPGTLPTEVHIRAVLTELLKDKQEATFREFCRYFEHKTKEQKRNLMDILRKVALVRKKTDKTLVISWKTQD